MATELVALKPDVILVGSAPATRALDATATALRLTIPQSIRIQTAE